MNCRVWRLMCACILFTALSLPSFSQNYYFVIGAFESESNDINTFAKNFVGDHADSLYAVSNDGTLAHFYVLKTNGHQDNVFTRRLPESSGVVSPPGILGKAAPAEPSASKDEIRSTSESAMASNVSSGSAVPAAPKGKYFKFTVDSYDGRSFQAPVHQVDLTSGTDVRTFESETYIDMLRPMDAEAPMTLVCGVFGYKPVEKNLDYYNPAETAGAYRDENGAWVIPYTLKRLEKGDVSVMYNVGFYKDAVAMLEQSKTDLDELVSMMQFNPEYKIKVHAYCNGKQKRSALALNDRHKYFDIEETVPVQLSARELTRLRAEAVRHYLADHNIDPSRVETYGWGGHDMLVDAGDPNARINDRIEIEILND